tara:strand:+ start:186 stop:506 length:321 start_codon:yes stop_codon:yes gene_type:complete
MSWKKIIKKDKKSEIKRKLENMNIEDFLRKVNKGIFVSGYMLADPDFKLGDDGGDLQDEDNNNNANFTITSDRKIKISNMYGFDGYDQDTSNPYPERRNIERRNFY